MAFSCITPKSEIFDITPNLAREMLSSSVGNRALRNWHVKILANSMIRGEWRVTSQGIGFDVNGNLRDGHHRLHACIIANRTIKSVVVFGLPINAYEVIDTNATRSYGDRLNESSAIANVLRLGCEIALGQSKPTIDEMKPIISGGLLRAALCIQEFCGARVKYYSSAGMRLAACICAMMDCDSEYVLVQYKALCHMDFDAMSPASKALVRQVANRVANSVNTRDTISRGLRVFDSKKRNISKIQLNNDDLQQSIDLVRFVLIKSTK